MLNSYYNDRIKFEFIDGLIKYYDLNKYDLFKEIGIGYNSYKTNKYRGKSTNNHLELFFSYFNVNDILEEKKIIYDKCIKELYYAIFFKTSLDLHSSNLWYSRVNYTMNF